MKISYFLFLFYHFWTYARPIRPNNAISCFVWYNSLIFIFSTNFFRPFGFRLFSCLIMFSCDSVSFGSFFSFSSSLIFFTNSLFFNCFLLSLPYMLIFRFLLRFKLLVINCATISLKSLSALL